MSQSPSQFDVSSRKHIWNKNFKKLTQQKLKRRVFKAKSDNYASASITVVEFFQTKSPNPPQHPFAKF